MLFFPTTSIMNTITIKTEISKQVLHSEQDLTDEQVSVGSLPQL